MLRPSFLSLSLALTLVGCSDGGGSNGGGPATAVNPVAPPEQSPSQPAPDSATTESALIASSPVAVISAPLSLNFAAKVQGEELSCYDRSEALKAKGQIFTDFRLFISNLALVNDQGEEIKLLLDVEASSTNLQFVDKKGNSIALLNYLEASCAASDATQTLKSNITGSIPIGHYTALKFQVGLPYPDQDPALTSIPAALAPSDMAWMWEHYPADFQIETNVAGTKKIVNALTSKNKTTLSLPLDFTHAEGAKAPSVELELSKLFLTTADAFINGAEKSCVNSDRAVTEASPHCAQVYKAFGLPVKDAFAPYSQTVFSIVP